MLSSYSILKFQIKCDCSITLKYLFGLNNFEITTAHCDYSGLLYRQTEFYHCIKLVVADLHPCGTDLVSVNCHLSFVTKKVLLRICNGGIAYKEKWVWMAGMSSRLLEFLYFWMRYDIHVMYIIDQRSTTPLWSLKPEK